MRDIKIRVLFVTHNSEFKREIKEHYTTVDRLMNGDDSFDYITGPEILAKSQFTGLQDNNGVDIYEGDIVSITYHGTNSISKYKPKQVKWDLEKCGFNISKGIDCEIIGNIHHNPELLETK